MRHLLLGKNREMGVSCLHTSTKLSFLGNHFRHRENVQQLVSRADCARSLRGKLTPGYLIPVGIWGSNFIFLNEVRMAREISAVYY